MSDDAETHRAQPSVGGYSQRNKRTQALGMKEGTLESHLSRGGERAGERIWKAIPTPRVRRPTASYQRVRQWIAKPRRARALQSSPRAGRMRQSGAWTQADTRTSALC